jgi:hypothetical protein
VNGPLRVVVWATGGVGSRAIRAVHRRPDLELVGVWVHSPDKDGRDAGELAGIDPIGLAATRDADALIALRPDCVVYAASGPERDAAAIPDYVRLLRAGLNVVTATSTMLVFPAGFFDADRLAELTEAAREGQASFYNTGIFPGFASDQLALVLSTQSNTIRTVRVTEVSLNDHYPVASAMVDGLGFAKGLDFTPHLAVPGFIEIVWRSPIDLIAAGLGVQVQAVHGRFERALTDRELHVAFGTVPAGTVGAVRTQAIGIVEGREAIIVEHVIRMARDVAPEWPQSDHDATYSVAIEGDPDITCTMNTGYAEGYGAGESAMMATTMRIVNAIPHVVAAAPGLLSSLDLPLTLPRHAFA